MLSRARRGVCEIVAGLALWRCRCEIVAGAALWRCRCRSRGRRSILCIWVCVCVAGVAFGSCLEGQDVVARAAGGVRNRGRLSTLAMPLRNRGRRSTLAMPLPKSWQAQHSVHLGVCLCGRGRIRQLSRGTGCCRAHGGGCAKSWQAQHFDDAVAKSWQAQHFGDAVAEVVARSILCIWVCVCVAGVAFGSCLDGQDVVARAAGGVRNRGRRSTLAMPLPKALHSVRLGVCLCGRGRNLRLSKGTGCWHARGGGRAKSWQAQHFGDAVAEVVAGAAFCASGCVFVWQG